MFKARYADQTPSDRFLVLVAYGTSVLKTGRRDNDFSIANAALLDILRLPQATRFDLDNMLWLPWARPFFCPRKTEDRWSTPTISVLPDALRQVLGWTMMDRDRNGLNDLYHALRDGPPTAQTEEERPA